MQILWLLCVLGGLWVDRFDAVHPEVLLEVRFYRILEIMLGAIVII